MKVRKAVIPAAGLGTRFLPFSKTVPKEMLPVLNKPAIQYIVEEAVASGIEEIIIITGKNKRSIEDYFYNNAELELHLQSSGKLDMLKMIHQPTTLANIHFVRQKTALGLGDAILTARSFIGNEPFAVLLGDMIMEKSLSCLNQLINVYNEYKAPVIAVEQVPDLEIGNYGIVLGEKKGERLYRIHRLVEKPKTELPSRMAIMGRYILEPDIFDILNDTKPGVGGEVQLTDALQTLTSKRSLYAYQHEGKLYDVGNYLGYLIASIEWSLKNEDIRDSLYIFLKKLIADIEEKN
ncbi:UTP--glucose-1-phosphate uridylyltransferase GalU [Paenibacillus bouchesdurhonensis]|uniref:UTP--glucose-1-phosphate uridylyltransferase GalU n=1 Tax=Paenibacillus bouchesdurhonensis TaxID=1870990 RepID=UPI000DA5FBE6|nr:UTP--glucose-1-phosphate uridylyltransferase GalU [Paenibacillus bouchesdurhonensis]